MKPHEHPATIMYAKWLAHHAKINGDTEDPTEWAKQWLNDVERYTTTWPSWGFKIAEISDGKLHCINVNDGEADGQTILAVMDYDIPNKVLSIIQHFDNAPTIVYGLQYPGGKYTYNVNGVPTNIE